MKRQKQNAYGTVPHQVIAFALKHPQWLLQCYQHAFHDQEPYNIPDTASEWHFYRLHRVSDLVHHRYESDNKDRRQRDKGTKDKVKCQTSTTKGIHGPPGNRKQNPIYRFDGY